MPSVALLALALLSLSACDTLFLEAPPRELDDDPPPMEGEGEGSEGEGEGEPVALCGGATIEVGPELPMGSARTRHAAALLLDGRVLVAGGHNNSYVAIPSAELFDPQSGAFAATGAMATPRQDFALVALKDGRALAIGGFQSVGGSVQGTELWQDGVWTPGPDLPEPRHNASAVVTDDGRVIIFGGADNAVAYPQRVLIFDPADDSLTMSASDVSAARGAHTAHTLADGRSLMIGGYYTSPLADVDVVFADGRASPGPAIPGPRRSACAANDDVGDALIFGGYAGGALADVQRYSAGANTWSAAAPLPSARSACKAVTLSCAALVCGGVDVTSCDAWDFAAEGFAPAVAELGAEFDFTMTTLGDDRVLVTGGVLGDGIANVLGTARILTLR